MRNALSSVSGPPPAPKPNAAAAQQGNALGPASASPDDPQQPTSIAPPDHQQTVAALRHFTAVEAELKTLLTDPACGKSDLKSKAIDGAANLIRRGLFSPADAVQQLGTFPERPFDQKKWLEAQFKMAVQAGASVLDHHRAGFAGAPPSDDPGDPANHVSAIAGLVKQYRGVAA